MLHPIFSSAQSKRLRQKPGIFRYSSRSPPLSSSSVDINPLKPALSCTSPPFPAAGLVSDYIPLSFCSGHGSLGLPPSTGSKRHQRRSLSHHPLLEPSEQRIGKFYPYSHSWSPKCVVLIFVLTFICLGSPSQTPLQQTDMRFPPFFPHFSG